MKNDYLRVLSDNVEKQEKVMYFSVKMILFLYDDTFSCQTLLVPGSILLGKDVPNIIYLFSHIPLPLRSLFCERLASKVLVDSEK